MSDRSPTGQAPRRSQVDEQGVWLLSERGTVEVPWEELEAIRVRTRAGAGVPEGIEFVFEGRRGAHLLPLALAPRETCEWLQSLPGFDNAALIGALASVADAQLVLWEAQDVPLHGTKRSGRGAPAGR